ncbi:hypothetical protein D3C81_1426820 [compost metagenome]
MHAGGAEQTLAVIVLLAQAQGCLTVAEAGAGQHHLHDSGPAGALDEGFLLRGKARVSKVDADVDQLHGASLDSGGQHSRTPVFRINPC